MGEVYRARDTKLNRDVALKILPDAFARDPERLARFQREAQVLASLNHPNIGAIYGFEDSRATHALVLELVEGETLADRIAAGPLPSGRGAADRAADRRRARSGARAGHHPSRSEASQHQGHARWHREGARFRAGQMLTGRRAFPGDTITDVIASIVARDPDWRAIPPNLHPKTEELIRRCLAKNRKDRWHAIGDVRVELETIMADPHGLEVQARREASRQPLWRRALLPAAMAVSGALIAVAGTLAFLNTRSLPPPPSPDFLLRFPRASAFRIRSGWPSRCLPMAATLSI